MSQAGDADSGLPLELQLDASETESRLAAAGAVLDLLEDAHTKHLLLLSTSSQYLERQALALEQATVRYIQSRIAP